MNSVYESLRALLRTKEGEIKRLEKEIEALRVVLPIVAEAGEGSLEVVPETGKPKIFPGPDFNSVLSQAKAPQPIAERATGTGEINPNKPRTSWP